MSTNDLPLDPAGTIPVAQAMQMTANWRTYLSQNNPAFNVRSYNIPIISFQNLLLNNPEAESVQAYIGLTDVTDPSTTQLLLIPVVNGKEVPYLPGPDNGDGDDEESNIYDLSAPCPPFCPDSGGLDG